MTKRTMPRQRPGLSESSVGTPPEFILAACRKLGIDHFVFDLAASVENTICLGFYNEADDALDPSVSWKFDGWSFLNPPYSRLAPWVAKACDEATNGADIAVLVPAATGSNWWKKFVDKQARVLLLNGRIAFVGHEAGYPKDIALLLYGPNELPGYEPWSWQDELTDEEKQMAKRRIGKKKEPKGKKAKAVKGKRAATVTDIGSRKKRGSKKETVGDVIRRKEAETASAARVTTFKPNGSTSQGMPSLKDYDPGKIELPTPEESQKVLGELAALNDQALKAHARHEELKGYTKTAKDKYDELMEQVANRLRQATHASDLPLFADVEKREKDQKAMETAGAADPTQGAEPAAGESGEATASEPEPVQGSEPSAVPVVPAPASEPALIDDDSAPF